MAKDALVLLGLGLLNVAVVYPLFQGEYTQYRASVEPVYMAAARFISLHPPYPTWNPLWYGGYPFRIFYTPLLPYTLALINALLAVSIPTAYRFVTAFSYVVTPLTWYAFVSYLTRRRLTAVLAALGYSILPSIAYLVEPVRADALTFGYAPWRLIALMRYGEGPHTFALAFAPLAALFFLRSLRRPRLINYLLGGLFAAAVALINFIALYALAVFLVAILISEMALGEAIAKLRSAVLFALLAFGLCAFWFNVSFIRASFSFGGGTAVLGNFATAAPVLLFLLLGCSVFFALCRGKPWAQPLYMSLLWFASLGAIILSWYGSQVAISPQPNRYIPEWDMAFTLLVAALITWVYDRLARRPGGRIPAVLWTLAVLISLGLLSVPFLRVAHTTTRPGDGMDDSSEYQIARWFGEHTSEEERVYVTGNTTFWLNLFSDVAQVRGGLDQSATNPWWDHATYQINSGEDGSVAVLWAKAFNVRYMLVNYPESSDPYRDYAYPSKLEGLLPCVWEQDGNSIFEVPLYFADLVLAIDSDQMRSLPPLRDGADAETLRRYVQVIEQGREVAYIWDGLDRFTVETEVRDGEAVLVRMTYDAGWRAWSYEGSVPVKADRLGFILLEPGPGKQVIELSHGRVWDEFLGYGITLLTVAALVAYPVARQLGHGAQRHR